MTLQPLVGAHYADIPKIKDKVVQTVVVQRLPIEITDIETVGFKKEWWKFWKK